MGMQVERPAGLHANLEKIINGISRLFFVEIFPAASPSEHDRPQAGRPPRHPDGHVRQAEGDEDLGAGGGLAPEPAQLLAPREGLLAALLLLLLLSAKGAVKEAAVGTAEPRAAREYKR